MQNSAYVAEFLKLSENVEGLLYSVQSEWELPPDRGDDFAREAFREVTDTSSEDRPSASNNAKN